MASLNELDDPSQDDKLADEWVRTYKPGDEIPPEIRRVYLDRLKKWSDKVERLTAEMACYAKL